MVPLWVYAPSTALLVLGAFLIQFMVQGAWGIIPAHLSELSPDSVRGFLPGFAYQCGVLVASSVVYIEAVFARTMSYATAMALTAVTVFALAAIVAAVGKERKGHVFGAGVCQVWITDGEPRAPLRSSCGRARAIHWAGWCIDRCEPALIAARLFHARPKIRTTQVRCQEHRSAQAGAC